MKARTLFVGALAAATMLTACGAADVTRPAASSRVGGTLAARDVAGLPLSLVADVPLSGGPGRFDYVSFDAKRRVLFIAHSSASTVTAFDVDAGKIVADIPNVARVHGVLAVPELNRVYAAATDTNEIVVIDETTMKEIARVPGGTYPDGMAYDPIHQRVFVSDEKGNADTVIDAKTNTVIATIPLGGEVGNTQFDPVGRRMLVNVGGLNQVTAIDPKTNQVSTLYPLPGADGNHGMLVNGEKRVAYIACEGSATLLTVNLKTMAILGTATTGEKPDVLAYDAGLQRLYVACESGTVSAYDTASGVAVKVGEALLDPGAHSIAVDPKTHRVFLPLMNVNGQPVLRVMAPFARTKR